MIKTAKERRWTKAKNRFNSLNYVWIKQIIRGLNTSLLNQMSPSKNRIRRMKRTNGETGKSTITIRLCFAPTNRHLRYTERRGFSQA